MVLGRATVKLRCRRLGAMGNACFAFVVTRNLRRKSTATPSAASIWPLDSLLSSSPVAAATDGSWDCPIGLYWPGRRLEWSHPDGGFPRCDDWPPVSFKHRIHCEIPPTRGISTQHSTECGAHQRNGSALPSLREDGQGLFKDFSLPAKAVILPL